MEGKKMNDGKSGGNFGGLVERRKGERKKKIEWAHQFFSDPNWKENE